MLLVLHLKDNSLPGSHVTGATPESTQDEPPGHGRHVSSDGFERYVPAVHGSGNAVASGQ